MTIKVKIPERRPGAVRLRAHLLAAPAPKIEEPAARHTPVHTPLIRPLPKFPPLRLGQALRASLLVAVCFGFAQLPQADRASVERTTVASLISAK